MIPRGAALVLLLASTSPVLASSYSETTDGDLSNTRSAPTDLGPIANADTLTGHSQSGDRDYATLGIPDGSQLDAITIVSASGDTKAFCAIQAGTTFTEPPTGTDVANLLGYAHFGTAAGVPGPGDDLLAAMAAGVGAIGFTPPLPAGDYTLWIQETSTGTSYQFRFDVSPVSSNCVGDLDDNGGTDVLDFSIFAANFGQNVTPGTGGDLDGSGTVDVLDFALFAGDFGCAP